MEASALSQPVSASCMLPSFKFSGRTKTENWTDFADDLMSLADKTYANLQEEAREHLALNAYLEQIDNTQISFSMKQKRQ